MRPQLSPSRPTHLYYTMKKRILIIDHDKQLNKINENVLLTAGIVNELHITGNGQEALNYFRSRIENNHPLPQIVIFDLHLPVLSGFEFIDEFAKLDFPGKAGIELVVFTYSSSVRDRERALSKGIRHYLPKPYLLRNLMNIVARTNSLL
jgi:CheY-like chemotaxis protein